MIDLNAFLHPVENLRTAPSRAAAQTSQAAATLFRNALDAAANPVDDGPARGDAGTLEAGGTPGTPASPAPVPATPTAESVFGERPWIASPTGVGPLGRYSYNPIYFATQATAEKVAAMLGGRVVASNAIINQPGTFSQEQPNLMVQLANGRVLNAGLVAAYFTHGYPQSYIDRLIAAETSGTNV